MADTPINGINSAGTEQQLPRVKPIKTEAGSSFENVINEALGKVSQVQNDVEKAVRELATGGDITSAIIAVEKADMTFNLMVEVRNKLLRAYEEVMKMNV